MLQKAVSKLYAYTLTMYAMRMAREEKAYLHSWVQYSLPEIRDRVRHWGTRFGRQIAEQPGCSTLVAQMDRETSVQFFSNMLRKAFREVGLHVHLLPVFQRRQYDMFERAVRRDINLLNGFSHTSPEKSLELLEDWLSKIWGTPEGLDFLDVVFLFFESAEEYDNAADFGPAFAQIMEDAGYVFYEPETTPPMR